ncbi:MAG TPA: ABC transporter ATP-binding protein [Labilithrix sp.]|nr:ABC transporter ATP-binding protein [Labilithrix sp.]
MAFITVTGVAKTYPSRRATTDVLRDVNLTIERGEFVAIVGYSGSGKSTLLSILAGLVPPDSGEVTMADKRVKGPSPERGVVFQNYSLLPWLSVTGNVRLAVDRVFPQWSQAERAEQVNKYVAMVNLTSAANKKPSELSGGMRQRVAVARALAMEPDVLLMDEPFGALDALTRATLQDQLARIWQETGRTIVLVTNDVEEALLLADRIVPLSHGPAATLGPSIVVEAARPRRRREMNYDTDLCTARARVLEYLLQSSKRARPTASGPRLAPSAEAAREGELAVEVPRSDVAKEVARIEEQCA